MKTTPWILQWYRNRSGLFKYIFNIHGGNSLHGEARWAEKGESKKSLFNEKNEGVYIGNRRLSEKKSCEHVAHVGPTGVGKTTSGAIRNILECMGSQVVLDVSGELFRNTSGRLAERGVRIRVLNLSDFSKSDLFDIFRRADTPLKRRQKVTTVVMSQVTDNDSFWTKGAIRAMFIGLSILWEGGDLKDRTGERLRWFMNQMLIGSSVVDEMINKEGITDRTLDEYHSLINEKEDIMKGYISTAKASLDLWQEDEICRLTSHDTMDLDEFRTRQTIYYIIVPQKQVTYFSPIINLFYQECFDSAIDQVDKIHREVAVGNDQLQEDNGIEHYADYGKLKKNSFDKYTKFVKQYKALGVRKSVTERKILTVYFLMDEFGNLGNLANFSATANTVRKYGCSITIILQSKSQLDATYGKDQAKSIWTAMVSKVYYPGMDLEMCEYLEKVLGKNTVYDTQSGGSSEYSRTVGVSLLRSDEIRMLGVDQRIFISGSERPELLEAIPFYRDERQLAMTQKFPYPMYTRFKKRDQQLRLAIKFT